MKKIASLFSSPQPKRKSEPVVNSSRHASDISEFYKIGAELGKGGFAVVKKGIDKQDDTVWALKLIQVPVFKKNEDQTVKECQILASLNHPGVVRLKEVVFTNKHFVIVLELLSGGELFDRIVKKEKYGESDAKKVALRLLEILAYLHENGIAHRDLKPENLLFDGPSDDADLKITDFGFAANFDSKHKLTATCGTPEYVAPEVLDEKPYDSAVDIWSAGVIIYILLCGFPPFFGDNDDQLFDRICKAEYKFLSPYWDPISADAKDLIRKMLELDPQKRLTAKQAMAHPWFKNTRKTSGAEVDLASAIEELKRYNAVRKLKKGVLMVVAANKIKGILKKI